MRSVNNPSLANLTPLPNQTGSELPSGLDLSPTVYYFLYTDDLYCFSRLGTAALYEVGGEHNESRGNETVVQDVPIPVPPAFMIQETTSSWNTITLFESQEQAEAERATRDGIVQVQDESADGSTSGVDVEHTGTNVKPERGPKQGSPPFQWSEYSTQAQVDSFCEMVKAKGNRNIVCPFCGAKPSRLPALKTHLYFRFRIQPYKCTKGCGQGWSTKANAERHEKTCNGKEKQNRQPAEWAPSCRPSKKRRAPAS